MLSFFDTVVLPMLNIAIAIVTGAFGLILVFIIISVPIGWIQDAVEKRKKKTEVSEAELQRKYEEIMLHEAQYEEIISEITAERDELKERISYLNQQDWKGRYDELHMVYYRLYEQYVKKPTATAAELFPINDEEISIIKLQTELNNADNLIYELKRQLSNSKGDCIEYQNEIKALKFQLKELSDMYYDTKKESTNKKQVSTIDHNIEISAALDNNLELLYDSSPNLKRLYAQMDMPRVYGAFDPTLCFKNITYEIAHKDKPNSRPYITTLTSCTCNDFKNNTKGKKPCKHMIFLAYNIGNMLVNKEETEKYFKEDVNFLEEKQRIEKELKELKKDRKKIRDEIKELKKQKTALSDGEEI